MVEFFDIDALIYQTDVFFVNKIILMKQTKNLTHKNETNYPTIDN